MKTLITIVSIVSISCGVLLWKAPDIIMYKIQKKPPHKVERFIGELTMSPHYHDNVKKHLITLWKKESPDNHIS